MKTIAIIEDDEHIGNILAETLTREGYDVVRAYSGTEAILLFQQWTPDLVLLDLMLPGRSGEELLPELKGIPVIVVSAKAGIDDRVNSLLGGAADYITKPFEIKELLARITVQLRSRSDHASVLTFGDLTLNKTSHALTVQGHPVHLTKTEFAIIKLLMLNPTQAIAKSVLLDRISMDTPDCMESSLKVHISNMRRKLREVSGNEYIEAVWGIGFKLSEHKS
ncbi:MULTISPECIES: response regulator transcription factor [unclassified Paenibacillus]|uniref:response regulator transcription factor n=1 Tax=unclassified Paenibacillus TaxID=185978 RepID=UPI003119D1FF